MVKDSTHDTAINFDSVFNAVLVVNPGELHVVPNGTVAGVKLSKVNAPAFVKMMQEIHRLKKRFVVVLDEPADEVCFELLLHALFQQHYLFVDNKPVIIFGPRAVEPVGSTEVESLEPSTDNMRREPAVADLEATVTDTVVASADINPDLSAAGDIGRINERLVAQGFAGAIDWQIYPVGLSDPRTVRPVVINESVLIDESWLGEHLFSGFEALSNFVIFDFPDTAAGLRKARELDALCREFLMQHPLLPATFAEYILLKQKADKDRVANARLIQQLAGAEKTIGVIRTKYKDDYEKLFKWYHNEYEILPLWYKRVGHIIKVMMGKRSFRSLFSDDVKKYKD